MEKLTIILVIIAMAESAEININSTKSDFSCIAFNPTHGDQPQNSTPLYNIEWTKNNGSLPRVIEVSIKVTSPLSDFRGFIISTLEVNTEKLIGSWTRPGELVLLNDSCVIMLPPEPEELTKQRQQFGLRWTPPEHYTAKVYFRATIIKNYETFWDNIQSSVLNYKDGFIQSDEDTSRRKRENDEETETNKELDLENISEVSTQKSQVSTQMLKSRGAGKNHLTTQAPSKKSSNKKLWTTIKHGTTTRKTPPMKKTTLAVEISSPSLDIEYSTTLEESSTFESKDDSKQDFTPNNSKSNLNSNNKFYIKNKTINRGRNFKNENALKIVSSEIIDNNETIESESRDTVSTNNTSNSYINKTVTKKQNSNTNTASKANLGTTTDKTEIIRSRLVDNKDKLTKVTKPSYKLSRKGLSQEVSSVSSNTPVSTISSKMGASRPELLSFQYTIPKRSTIASRTAGSNVTPEQSTSRSLGFNIPIMKKMTSKSNLVTQQEKP